MSGPPLTIPATGPGPAAFASTICFILPCPKMMAATSASNRANHSARARLAAFLALSFSSQVRGRIPCARNVATAARLMQIRLARNNRPAPSATAHCAEPSASPRATNGGSSATATMTPTRAEDSRPATASAPAQPAASPRAMSDGATSERDAIWPESKEIGSTMPISTASARATPMATKPVFNARRNSFVSPIALANASAMFGPSRGAITMAPMTTATLSRHIPMAATSVDRRTSTT